MKFDSEVEISPAVEGGGLDFGCFEAIQSDASYTQGGDSSVPWECSSTASAGGPCPRSGRVSHMASNICSRFVIDHSIIDDLCEGPCFHVLGGCQVQLNRCNFYRELFLSGSVDIDADYIYHGVSHGFDIVDTGCPASYHCSNYDSIKSAEFRSQMDSIVKNEIEESKVTMVNDTPRCIHALGAVRKANGKLHPITDCRRPLLRSINNYMSSTFVPLHYVTLD